LNHCRNRCRLAKETSCYEKEAQTQSTKVDAMAADKATDEYVLKKQREVLQVGGFMRTSGLYVCAGNAQHDTRLSKAIGGGEGRLATHASTLFYICPVFYDSSRLLGCRKGSGRIDRV
jgi:hypothetical protein